MEKTNENKRDKKNLVALLVLCVSIVALTASLTYAYFVSQVAVNEQEKVTITSGTLALTFRDNDDTVKNIEATWGFGDTIEKELIIENTGTRDTYAKISWENLINTYLAESLTYTLKVKPEGTAEYTPVRTTRKNVPRSDNPAIESLAEGLLIEAGKTNSYMLTIKLEDLEEVDQTQDINAKFVTKFTIEETAKPAEVLLVNELLRKTNPIEVTEYTSGDRGEMYTFDHETTVEENTRDYGETRINTTTQIEDWTAEERRDYRYIGSAPNNYIRFNDEMWRIIGVFTVENEDDVKEQRVKIMRDESIGDLPWNETRTDDWTMTTLNQILNNDYFTRSGEYSTKGLNEVSQKQISALKYFIGGDHDTYYYGWKGNGLAFYSYERRLPTLLSKVGLMYASDVSYTLAKNFDFPCFDDVYDFSACNSSGPSESWIAHGHNKWTMSNFTIIRDGIAGGMFSHETDRISGEDSIYPEAVHPVVYLNHDIVFNGGDGRQDNPYTIR